MDNVKDYKFPYIQKLINRICDTYIDYSINSFSYYERYDVNMQNDTTNFKNITIFDKKLDNKLIANIDFNFVDMLVVFNYIYSENLMRQFKDAFRELYRCTKEYRQVYGFYSELHFQINC